MSPQEAKELAQENRSIQPEENGGASADGIVAARPTPPDNGRAAMLSRIRRALRVPAPHAGRHNGYEGAPIDSPVVNDASANTLPVEGAPGVKQGQHINGSQFTGTPPKDAPQFVSTLPILGQADSQPASGSPRAWLPLVGETEAEQLALFATNSKDLRTEFVVCESREAALEYVQMLASSEGWTQVGAHRGTLTDVAVTALDLPVVWVDGGYDKLALEACEAGLTECEALIAQTGTVLVTSRGQGGRGLSILPPHHVVLATRDQLVPDLPAAFELLRTKYGDDVPSMISFITGPSRTGDIERILVLGAHGPKQLTIVVF